MNQGQLTLYDVDYPNREALNNFYNIVDSTAFADVGRNYVDPTRISASLLNSKDENKHYVLIAGPDFQAQAETLGEVGINLKNPREIIGPHDLERIVG